jgi:hypothetical protein
LIREHRKAFEGNPDPDIFAKMEIQSHGNGYLYLGGICIDAAKHTYSVTIGIDSPAPFFYSGTFVEHDGIWTASLPNVLHPHRPFEKTK